MTTGTTAKTLDGLCKMTDADGKVVMSIATLDKISSSGSGTVTAVIQYENGVPYSIPYWCKFATFTPSEHE